MPILFGMIQLLAMKRCERSVLERKKIEYPRTIRANDWEALFSQKQFDNDFYGINDFSMDISNGFCSPIQRFESLRFVTWVSLLTIPRYPYAATRNIWPKEVPELEEAFKATGKLVSWIPKNTGIQPESMGEWYSDANFRWGSWRAFKRTVGNVFFRDRTKTGLRASVFTSFQPPLGAAYGAES